MSVSERSEDWVADQLSRLTDEYGSAPVHQVSWSVSGSRYDEAAAADATEHAAAGVRVTNDTDETLLVRDRHSEWAPPRGAVAPDESLEAGAVRNVREATGIECEVDDIERITIVSIGDESDRDRQPIYCLIVLFVGSCDSNQTVQCTESPVRWRHSRPTDSLDPGVLAI